MPPQWALPSDVALNSRHPIMCQLQKIPVTANENSPSWQTTNSGPTAVTGPNRWIAGDEAPMTVLADQTLVLVQPAAVTELERNASHFKNNIAHISWLEL